MTRRLQITPRPATAEIPTFFTVVRDLGWPDHPPTAPRRGDSTWTRTGDQRPKNTTEAQP